MTNENIVNGIKIAVELKRLSRTQLPDEIFIQSMKVITSSDDPLKIINNVERFVIAAITLAMELNSLQTCSRN